MMVDGKTDDLSVQRLWNRSWESWSAILKAEVSVERERACGLVANTGTVAL